MEKRKFRCSHNVAPPTDADLRLLGQQDGDPVHLISEMRHQIIARNVVAADAWELVVHEELNRLEVDPRLKRYRSKRVSQLVRVKRHPVGSTQLDRPPQAFAVDPERRKAEVGRVVELHVAE